MNRHPRDPHDRWDPFNDPFFKQFEQMHQHIFRDFFGGDRPSIMIEHPDTSQTPYEEHKNAPDLSQINPNAPSSKTKDNHNYSNQNGPPSMLRMFKHFFEPEYDEHRLSDINPNITENGPIMSNEDDNKGLIHPDSHPPGFRSPYLPHSNGAEKNMEFSNNGGNAFYRSQSVVISTGSDGRTTKTTTIRDSNGERTTTEEYNADNDGCNDAMDDILSIFHWNGDNGNEANDNEIQLFTQQRVPLFERTHDPLERFRHKWQNWKWNPYNWYTNDNDSDNGSDHHDHKKVNDEIKWRPYREYNSENNKGPSLLDDIVKKKD